jgi:WD40 repeat protein
LGHLQPIYSAKFSADGQAIATVSDDGSARVWDSAGGAEEAGFRCASRVTRCCELDGGRRVATAHMDGTLRVWNREDEWDRAILERKLPDRTDACAAFDRAGARVALTAGNQVLVYDVKTRRIRVRLEGHAQRVRSVAFTPDDNEIVTASEDRTARRWNAWTGESIGALGESGSSFELRSIDVSPDGRQVVIASEDGVARVIDRVTNEIECELPPAGLRASDALPGLFCAYFSPDGRRVVTTSQTGARIQVWDLSAGARVVSSIQFPDRSQVPDRFPLGCTFTPDGRRLVAGTADGRLVLLDSESGRQIHSIATQAPFVHAACSPSGKYIASGSYDRTVHVRDADSLAEIAVLPSHRSGVNFVAYSPDGRTILSIADDRSVHLWPADALDAARERAPRELTDEERRRFELPASSAH